MATTEPRAITFAVWSPLGRADLPGLCERVCALLASSGAQVAYCDVDGIAPDAVAVDALAQLQRGARRHDCTVRLQNASDELRALVEFMGLTAVLPS